MRRPSVLVIFLTVFIDLIGFGIVVPLVPVYSKHLVPACVSQHWAQGLVVGVIVASFSAMQFLFSPFWGRLSDRRGRRPRRHSNPGDSGFCVDALLLVDHRRQRQSRLAL